LETLQRNNYN